MSGKLIVIEGLDSSGKETQSRKLAEYLSAKHPLVKRIEFPNYQSPSSSLVKMYLAGEFGKEAGSVNAYAASAFYAVDRYATYKKDFESLLNENAIIIADRYVTSNLIHQASKITDTAKRDKYLDWVCDFEYNLLALPRPDKVIFLNMPTDVSVALMKERANKATGSSKKDIHESDIEYLKNTYNCAMEMVKKYSWDCVNCSENGKPRSIEDIANDIIKLVDGE